MIRRRRITEWPAWRYSPDGEGAIFECEEDVPHGWYKTPQSQLEAVEAKPPVDYDAIANQLQGKIDKVDPRWGNAKLWEELQKVLNND